MKIKAKQMPPLTGFTNGKVYDVLDRYNHGYVVINDNGEESKIHEFNTEIVTGHPHAELIMKYAEIAQNDPEPWKHFEMNIDGCWKDCNNPPMFIPRNEYRLKPRTININGFEVPEPLRHEPSDGTDYYVLDVPEVLETNWASDVIEYKWLKAGLIHLTREAAEKHLEALLSFTKE